MRYGRIRRLYRSITDEEIFNECAHWEYSPRLQMGILGLDPAAVKGPVLDVGCGRRASLVPKLRSLGVEAYGLDLHPPVGEWFIETDWLEFDFCAYRWGTVTSHMAFTNHFAHHSMKVTGSFRFYKEAYERILSSIDPGGMFVYAPGLPSFESVLPKDDFGIRITGIAGIGEETDRFHAVRVIKLG